MHYETLEVPCLAQTAAELQHFVLLTEAHTLLSSVQTSCFIRTRAAILPHVSLSRNPKPPAADVVVHQVPMQL